MRDRRITPANGRVAAKQLEGHVNADRFVEGQIRQISMKTANLWTDTNRKSMDRQLVFGDWFLVLEEVAGLAFGQALKDGYVGYIDGSDLTDRLDVTHVICVRSAHLYPVPDLKSVPVASLSFGSSFQVIGKTGDYWKTSENGFVYRDHARDLANPMPDPALAAELFLGTPYLWGGNSCDGIDCSGLVQAALLACGMECPGDSDLQQASVGTAFGDNAPVKRGDLLFWKGHVAMALDGENLIHATAQHMSVVIENIETVTWRIAEQDGGPILSRRRP